ncbi:MAG: ABC transporter substrate-binding protein [Actinomycetota bacterium]
MPLTSTARPSRTRLTVLVATALVALAACGDDDATADTSSDTAAQTDPISTTPETAETEPADTAAPPGIEPPVETDAPTVTEGPVETEAPADTEPADDAAAFPVTIEHGLGETLIESPPERVVALGTPEADALFALGVAPVGAPSNPTAPDGLYVWWDGAIDPSATTLLVSDFSGAFNLEQVAALEPDLILAATSAVDESAYGLYEEIAPTVPFLTAPFQDSWQEVTIVVGAAVGMPDEADAVIASTSASIDRLRTDAPGLDGATYTFNVVPAPGAVISVTEPADVANRFFAELGLGIAPSVADLPRQPGTGAMISPEQLALIDTDVVMMFYASEDAAAAIRDSPVFAATAAASDGRVIELTGDQAVAVRVPSVLAVPWLLDSIGPQLVAAVG